MYTKLLENTKVRSLRGIYYGNIENCLSILESNCSHFALCMHDKDIDEENNLKKAHIHFIARFGKPRTACSFRKCFDEKLAHLFFTCEDVFIVEYYNYLIHQDVLGNYIDNKFPYKESSRIVDDISYWNREIENHTRSPTKSVDKGWSILSDLLDNVPFDEMCCKYGREFILNYEKYYNAKSKFESSIKPFNEKFSFMEEDVID